MVYQIFLSPLVKRIVIVTNEHIRVTSRVAEQVKSYALRKTVNIRKISELAEL